MNSRIGMKRELEVIDLTGDDDNNTYAVCQPLHKAPRLAMATSIGSRHDEKIMKWLEATVDAKLTSNQISQLSQPQGVGYEKYDSQKNVTTIEDEGAVTRWWQTVYDATSLAVQPDHALSLQGLGSSNSKTLRSAATQFPSWHPVPAPYYGALPPPRAMTISQNYSIINRANDKGYVNEFEATSTAKPDIIPASHPRVPQSDAQSYISTHLPQPPYLQMTYPGTATASTQIQGIASQQTSFHGAAGPYVVHSGLNSSRIIPNGDLALSTLSNGPATGINIHESANSYPSKSGFDWSNLKMQKPQRPIVPKEEKRLKNFRPHPPKTYMVLHDRATYQRMFVIQRTKKGTEEHPAEEIQLAGTTGNVYTVTIDRVPVCSCPHSVNRLECKHIVYCLVRVLRAPMPLQFQRAFMYAELREIFAKAPPIPDASEHKTDKNRKPVEGDCAICCTEFGTDTSEAVTWCKAACGNNIHADCFKHWAKTKDGTGEEVTCPFCRSPWTAGGPDEDSLKAAVKAGEKNLEGYINVADELGISGARDRSTYYRPPVRYGRW